MTIMSLMSHLGISAVLWTGCATLALCTPALSQVETQTGTFTTPRHHRLQGPQQGSDAPATQPAANPPSPAPASAPATPPATPQQTVVSATAPPSLLDKPAEPAKIDLASGNLTIHADNSSLADILNRLKADSGMNINGLGADQRVFGSYGPGDPQDVLFALLDGSGYNVVMLGRTETGTPKELSLTPRGATAPTAGPGNLSQQQMPQDEDNDDESQQPPPPEPPGAPQPAPEPTPHQNEVRTPQQMLQELQQMRQQQQLQMQQQQQQQQSSPPEQP